MSLVANHGGGVKVGYLKSLIMLLQFLEKRLFPYKDCFTQTSKDFNQFANSGLEQMLHFLFRFCHKRASLLRTFLTQLFYRDSLTHCLLTFLFSIVVSQFLVSESKSKLTPKEFFSPLRK